MNDSKSLKREIQEKFNKYKKDILNERMFLFKINQLFTDEFEEILEDILILNENQFMSQLRNRVEDELEGIYSDQIFSEKKFTNILEKGLNQIKPEYKESYDFISNIYDAYSKNKNSRRNDFEFLTNKYRRHCLNEVQNTHATHTCNKLGKFLLCKKSGKVEYVICINCQKVYYSNMILCKCYKCNKEYYTEIFTKNEDEFLLPATWENYHCKLIANEKIKCLKCHEIFYINMKTGMLTCLNKKCNFVSKPTRILWTCSICQEDFKCGAIPYNPLDLEIVKKIIKQTLFQKQRAHPYKVPCCKINVFFTEFFHKKKCPGILYAGELNGDIIIVCDKCHAINFFDRFIWTCPKCGNKFKDEKDNNVSEDSSEIIGNTFKTINSKSRRKNEYYLTDRETSNIDEDTSTNTLTNKNTNISTNIPKKSAVFVNKRPFFSNRGGDNNNKNDKRNEARNTSNKGSNEETSNVENKTDANTGTIEEHNSFKKFYTSRFRRKTNANDASNKSKEKEAEKEERERKERERKEKERKEKEERERREKEEREQKERERKEKEKEKEKEQEDNRFTRRYNRARFYTQFDNRKQMEKERREKEERERKEKEKEKEKDNEINNRKTHDDYEAKKNNQAGGFNAFSKYRQRRRMEEREREERERKEKEEREREEKERKEREREEKERKEREREEKERKEREREEKERRDKEERDNEDTHSQSSNRIGNYRSLKKTLDKKEDEEYASSKVLAKAEKRQRGTDSRRSHKSEISKSEKGENDTKLEEEEEVEEDDSKFKKRNKIKEESQTEEKKEENPSSFHRWKFRRPEGKKTLGKVIKEETETTANSNNNNTNKANNNSNEENSNTNTHENDSQKNNNNNQNNNMTAINPVTKIPGISDNLLNHLNKRISNIISKCSMPLMNVEDYILYQKIGEGSYGIIFSVINKKDKKQYALKKIISNKLKQIGEFTKEFELVYSCKHEGIMKIYSFCIRILDPTTYALYVLMELSEGDWDKEIKRKLSQRKNYSEKELINILYQLVSALLYIQENYHISHRDIKPQNVLVFPGGKYKLADFGEAKEAKVSRQINTLRGTELYMSPALYDGLKNEKNDVSHNPFKSDVFSLGFCFLYASALNFNLLYEVRDILDSRSINVILHKFLNKFYSEQLIMLLASMLEIDEAKRYDFRNIKEYIEKNFSDMIENRE